MKIEDKYALPDKKPFNPDQVPDRNLAGRISGCCKKQPAEQAIELEPRFPGDLYLVKVTKKTGIRMFINKIEVKNKWIIDRFISGEQNFGVQTQNVVSDEKIHFISPDTASMENRASKLVVTRDGDQYLFRSINRNPYYLGIFSVNR